MSITSETPAASIYDKQPHVVITNSHSEAIPDKSTPVEDLQLEWDGPDDVGCPRNWPLWKRIFHTAIPALHGLVMYLRQSILQVTMLTIYSTLAASSYVPAIPSIQVHFGVNQEVATLGVSLYLIGLALGPLPIAPLSEIIGRRYIYLVALPILVVFDIGAACAHNIQTLLILRFLGAIFGSGAIAVIAGTVVDVWDLNKGGQQSQETDFSAHTNREQDPDISLQVHWQQSFPPSLPFLDLYWVPLLEPTSLTSTTTGDLAFGSLHSSQHL